MERFSLDQQFALGSRALHVHRTILAADGSTVRAISNFNMDNGFTSRRHETETGLMYFRARYYDPGTGEFISRDPLEYVDGMSQYRGYFMPGTVDPDGRISIEIKPGGGNTKRKKCTGNKKVFQQWKFILSTKAPEPGSFNFEFKCCECFGRDKSFSAGASPKKGKKKK